MNVYAYSDDEGMLNAFENKGPAVVGATARDKAFVEADVPEEVFEAFQYANEAYLRAHIALREAIDASETTVIHQAKDKS